MSELFSALRISGSGMAVQRMKLNTTAENIANAETTRTQCGGPYRRKEVVVSAEDRPVNFSGEFKNARVRLASTHAAHRGSTRKFRTSELNVSDARAEVHASPKSDFKLIYDPSHPDADGDGYVAMPNINLVTEMVNMMVASRAFEANVTAIGATKEMISDAMDI
jgi:flagellar basal-body rod protein FlgC